MYDFGFGIVDVGFWKYDVGCNMTIYYEK